MEDAVAQEVRQRDDAKPRRFFAAQATSASPLIRSVEHAGVVVYLMNGNQISGRLLRECVGDGGSDTLSTEDDLSNPAASCISSNCKGHCKLFVKIPKPELAVFTVRAAAIDLPSGVDILGDVVSPTGRLITSRSISVCAQAPGPNSSRVPGVEH